MSAAPYQDVKLFIDGQWRAGSSAQTLAIHNPATGQVIGQLACATEADLAEAAQSAQRGFQVWRDVPAVQRRQIMHKAAALLRERAPQVGDWLTAEQGKPRPEALGEINMAADIIEWFADEGMRVHGRIVPARMPQVEQRVLKEPVGPVAAFTPWNFPINQVVRKLCAALTTGCSIVVKAAEETPASAAELIRAFIDAGVPTGVINLVFGDPAQISQFLITHPAIRKISFTGSTAVGKQLAALAGQHMKRATMELGGHAPVIIAADADPVQAAKAFGGAKFRNAGQICASPTRFLVHRALRADFEAALVAHADSLQVGPGNDPATQMGPLANGRRVHAMQTLVDDAKQRGARIAAGGGSLKDQGHFFAPTIVADAPLDSKLWNEEPFGPMIAIRSVDSVDEAITEANRLPYGLAAYAATRSAATVHQLSRELACGVLWINQASPAWPEMPFGGVKDSGVGAEGGSEALEPYLVTKSVSVWHG